MLSVADQLRRDDRHDERVMAPAARLRLALGRRDLETRDVEARPPALPAECARVWAEVSRAR